MGFVWAGQSCALPSFLSLALSGRDSLVRARAQRARAQRAPVRFYFAQNMISRTRAEIFLISRKKSTQ